MRAPLQWPAVLPVTARSVSKAAADGPPSAGPPGPVASLPGPQRFAPQAPTVSARPESTRARRTLPALPATIRYVQPTNAAWAATRSPSIHRGKAAVYVARPPHATRRQHGAPQTARLPGAAPAATRVDGRPPAVSLRAPVPRPSGPISTPAVAAPLTAPRGLRPMAGRRLVRMNAPRRLTARPAQAITAPATPVGRPARPHQSGPLPGPPFPA